MSCPRLKTGKGTKHYITADPAAEPIVWTPFPGVINFTPPAQDRDTVTSDDADQEYDMALESPAGFQNGDIAFGVEVKTKGGDDVVNAGHAILAAAHKSGDCVGWKTEIGGDPDNTLEMMSGIVTSNALQAITRTDKITYNCNIRCNAPYEPAEGDDEEEPEVPEE